MLDRKKLYDTETEMLKKAATIGAVLIVGLIIGFGLMAGNDVPMQGGGGGGGMGGGGYPMVSPGANRTLQEGYDIYNNGAARNSERIDNIRVTDSQQIHYRD